MVMNKVQAWSLGSATGVSGAGRPSGGDAPEACQAPDMLALAADEVMLWDAEHQVTEAEWRILCQLEHLEQVRRQGASTRAAEAVLEALRCGRDAWVARRVEILSEMRPWAALSSAA